MAPYNHFADKSALVAAAAEEGFRMLQSAMEGAVAGASGSAPERLAAGGVAYAVFAVRHPALFRLMFGPELADKRAHPGLATAAEAVFQSLLGRIAAVGIGPSDPVAARAFALTPWSLVHGLAMLAVAGQIPDATPAMIERLARQATGYLAVGLANLGGPTAGT
jgi:AcrR family transcriptional regulator